MIKDMGQLRVSLLEVTQEMDVHSTERLSFSGEVNPALGIPERFAALVRLDIVDENGVLLLEFGEHKIFIGETAHIGGFLLNKPKFIDKTEGKIVRRIRRKKNVRDKDTAGDTDNRR